MNLIIHWSRDCACTDHVAYVIFKRWKYHGEMKNGNLVLFCFGFHNVFFSVFFFFFFFTLHYCIGFAIHQHASATVYTCSPSWTLLPPASPYHPSGSSQCTSPNFLYPALNLDWRFVSYMILYMFQCHSPKSSHPLPLPQNPKDCSIHLCLFCRLIITITGLLLPSF